MRRGPAPGGRLIELAEESHGSYNLADLAWPDIVPWVRADAIVLVPVGSIEQHGPHLPAGTDMYHAQQVAERTARLADVPYAPTMPFGYSPHHVRGSQAGMGTITMRAATCQAVYRDIGLSLVHMGFEKLIFINGNASNFKVMDPAMRALRYRTGALVCVYRPYGERYLGLMAPYLEGPPEETPGWHSAEQETSQMLAHDPGLVHLDRVERWTPAERPPWMPPEFSKHDGTGDVEFKGHEYLYFYLEHGEFAPTGVIGNPLRATAAKGNSIYDAFAAYLADAIEVIRKIEVRVSAEARVFVDRV